MILPLQFQAGSALFEPGKLTVTTPGMSKTAEVSMSLRADSGYGLTIQEPVVWSRMLTEDNLAYPVTVCARLSWLQKKTVFFRISIRESGAVFSVRPSGDKFVIEIADMGETQEHIASVMLDLMRKIDPWA